MTNVTGANASAVSTTLSGPTASGHSDPFGLAQQVCAVTGAGSGIGRSIAVAFSKAGARVVVLDVNEEGSAETVREILETGGQAIAIHCDVADPVSIEAAAAQTLVTFGPCDVLVNNAGLIRLGGLDTLLLAEWNLLLSVNLTGYFLCSQIFGRQMRAKGKGALVHIASIAGSNPTAFSGAYSVAKAGVTMLAQQLAVEWGPHGIRSNTVHPGMILTPLSAAMYDQPGVLEQRSKAIPAGRIGRPEDVAEAVMFLASDRAAYINGDALTVDGGFSSMLLSLVPRAGYDRTAA
ncbi:SDR family NAD(P)-dependent oxidoreductase [Glaciimonas immobilis]|uniref:NAD(P)-dependent dehydrogenase (Short-subunit alcohol dehydrogenase family) n=1 Tax=Glaciimonas immobilis TaxID=728004 RepID=A0A840RXL0_9BURK|nr:SDR family oxidoreductase [Glaciimonas immobilis]KAF3996462.1 SDR family oxidoreductase [Glaciimonas immobilis]MBB5201190.1 NAD(P)-dependent dehydrogenase (short-subunit alcohol dehydrogenase family) [Glaciimonas immobilis]